MRGEMVLSRGELHIVVDEAIAQIEDDEFGTIIVPVALISKIEKALIPGHPEQFWTPVENLHLLPSQINPARTEWTMGVRNGLKNED